MKDNIHPQYKDVKVTCSCGNSFVTRSAMEKSTLTLEVCSQCHPFYTGTQKLLDSAGRVDKFRQRYAKKPAVAKKPEPVEVKKEPAKVKATAKKVAPVTKKASHTKAETKVTVKRAKKSDTVSKDQPSKDQE